MFIKGDIIKDFTGIISDLSCELKRERKMQMSIRDTGYVDYYAVCGLK